MPVDYNINISVNGGDRRNAYGGGNVYKTKTTLNSRNMSEDGGFITESNLRNIFTVGMAFSTLQQANELAGAYTNNRIQQRKNQNKMTFVKYGVGVAINPLGGSVYALKDLGYRSLQYAIQTQKQNREAEFYGRLSGSASFSGRNYGGSYL